MSGERNIKISIVKGTDAKIVRKSDLYSLLKLITTSEKLKESREELNKLYSEDYQRYKVRKNVQPGFILGDFSYRSVDNCLEYYPTLGFDIDKIPNKEKMNSVFETLKKWEYSFLVMPSISGFGLRVLVCADCAKDLHKNYYGQISGVLSKFTGIPIKSKIRESLRDLNYPKEQIENHIAENIHIDDAMYDISRFWYYSGLDKSEIFFNRESSIYKFREEKEQKTQVKAKRRNNYQYEFTEEDKVEYLVSKIESSHIDITKGVYDWFKLGQSLYSEFGHNAKDYFIRISKYHPEFKEKEAEKEWQRIQRKHVPGLTNLGTFYKWCQDYGLGIDFKELKEQHREKFEKAELSTIKPIKPKEDREVALSDKEAERCIIATCLTNQNLIDLLFDTCPKFSNSCFADRNYKLIFKVIQAMLGKRLEVNSVSVASQLKFEKTSLTIKELNYIIKEAFYPDDIRTNTRIVYELFLRRKIIELSHKAVGELSTANLDVFEYVDHIQNDLRNISDFGLSSTEGNALTIASMLLQDYDKMQEFYKNNGTAALTGVPTGIIAEDLHTGGYQESDLIILAGRPGMGKTSRVLKTALVASQEGFPVGLFSLEMSKKQLGQRMVSLISGIPLKKIRNGGIEENEKGLFFSSCEEFGDLPIYIDDKTSITVDSIHRIAARWKREHNIKILIVDYLQMIKPKTGTTKNEKVEDISIALKAIAKDLNLPVIALSQLSRAVEVRGGTKRPQLSDLRDSGAIEQNADVVAFIYRPEYYEILENEAGESLKGIAEVIYAKHRNGSLKTITCGFRGRNTEFYDTDTYEPKTIDEATKQDLEDSIVPTPVYDNIIKSPVAGRDDKIPF